MFREFIITKVYIHASPAELTLFTLQRALVSFQASVDQGFNTIISYGLVNMYTIMQ